MVNLIAPSSAASHVVRLAASIYLKNRIATSWKIPYSVAAAAALATVGNDSTEAAALDGLVSIIAAKEKANYVAIPAEDRDALKHTILPLLSALAEAERSTASLSTHSAGSSISDSMGVVGGGANNGPIKLQVAQSLATMIDTDFPRDWSTLIDDVARALQSERQGDVEAGVRATVEVLRGFRYVLSIRFSLPCSYLPLFWYLQPCLSLWAVSSTL